MTRKVFALALALALLLCAVPVSADNSSFAMYVYTDNGKGLNVRSTPYVGENIIGLAPYGSKVMVRHFLENGWACIEWSSVGEAYVQARYLQGTKPASRNTRTSTPTPVPYISYNNYNNYSSYSNSGYETAYTDTLAVLNAEFRTARIVSPFTVVVRPTRASGWVNMRWAPSKDTEVMTTYRSGVRLTVVAETQSWYQVSDPSTGVSGYIMKAYTTRQY